MRLFREEVLQAQSAQYLGSIRIGRRPSFAAVTAVSMVLGAALVAYAVCGEITRKARLPGILAPTLGTLQLSAPQAGTIAEVRVKEGDRVAAGKVLMVVGVLEEGRLVEVMRAAEGTKGLAGEARDALASA